MISLRVKLAVAFTFVTLPLLAGIFAFAGDGDQHLKCVEVKDLTTANDSVTADLSPQSGAFADQNCRIRLRGGHFCFPTDKDNVLDEDGNPVKELGINAGSAQDTFCYLIKCKREGPKDGIPLRVRDQFGERDIHVKDADFLCAPAVKDAVPTPTPTEVVEVQTATPTPTATVTPTATPTPQGCSNDGGQCGGDCPNAGDQCLFVGKACSCVPSAAACGMQPDTTSMELSVGQCAGLCPGSNDVCVPNARQIGPGCACVLD